MAEAERWRAWSAVEEEKFASRDGGEEKAGMKTSHWLVGIVAAGWSVLVATAAEESFSKTVPPADFSAAGLSKLTPQELARLDALVRDYKSGALEAARREAIAAAEARSKAEAATARAEAAARSEAERAAKAEEKARVAQAAQSAERSGDKPDTSLLKRAKVLLTPGTQIEYSTVDARIVGEFRGWAPKRIFTLDNGQRWQVIGADDYFVSAEQNPKVKIVPGALGAFFMHVEGHRQRAKVTILSDGR